MAQWTVETRTKAQRSALEMITKLRQIEIFHDGSVLVDCPEAPDEDILVEYCETNNLDCSI